MIDLLATCVFLRLLYTAETRTLRGANEKKLLAFKIRCQRGILKVS